VKALRSNEASATTHPTTCRPYPTTTEALEWMVFFSVTSRRHQLLDSFVFRSLEINMQFFFFEVKNTSERSYSIVLKFRDNCAACTSNIALLWQDVMYRIEYTSWMDVQFFFLLFELYKCNNIFPTFRWQRIVTNSHNNQDGTTVPSWSCSQAVSKPVWHIPLLCAQWKTADVIQRNCPKHVEFHSKINLRN